MQFLIYMLYGFILTCFLMGIVPFALNPENFASSTSHLFFVLINTVVFGAAITILYHQLTKGDNNA